MGSQSRSGRFGRDREGERKKNVDLARNRTYRLSYRYSEQKKKSHTFPTGARMPTVPRTEGQSPLETSVQVGEH
jgi:hypothetical protein